MHEPRKKGVGARKLTSIRRKSLSTSQEQWIKTGCLEGGYALPLVIRPLVEGIRLIDWAQNNRAFCDGLILKHRALLFRDFSIRSVAEFSQFVSATSNGPPLEYIDRTTPRTTMGEGIYTSTVYPADQQINLHNEGTYWLKWARKLYFCCIKAAERGGATPIADVRNVYKRIDLISEIDSMTNR